jgi:hypothetical protein
VLAAIGELMAAQPARGFPPKLLRRLEGHSLIENTGVGHAKGGSNAWGLTAKGEEVRRELERRFG